MKYTVKLLADIAQISVRTLHFYDEIGLLKPAFTEKNGYRYYTDKEVGLLQQILFFRELDFSLDQIKKIMKSTSYDSAKALHDQRRLLELKQKRLTNIITLLDKTINSMKGGDSMKNNDKFSAFSDPAYQKYKNEVEERWSNTEAYKQSMERVSRLSKSEFEKIKKEGGEITSAIAGLMKKGFEPENPEVQKEIERYFKYLHHFYDPGYEIFRGLGEMYVSDSRFTQFYEKIAKGLAVFMRDSMIIYADSKLNKN